jgi:hypothetical protein
MPEPGETGLLAVTWLSVESKRLLKPLIEDLLLSGNIPARDAVLAGADRVPAPWLVHTEGRLQSP